MTKSYRNSINPDGFATYLGFRVASTALTADFDFDGDVDHDDLAIWSTAFGTTADGDTDGDGDSDGGDFLAWQRNFDGNVPPLTSPVASVPEPTGIVLGSLGLGILVFCYRRSV